MRDLKLTCLVFQVSHMWLLLQATEVGQEEKACNACNGKEEEEHAEAHDLSRDMKDDSEAVTRPDEREQAAAVSFGNIRLKEWGSENNLLPHA